MSLETETSSSEEQQTSTEQGATTETTTETPKSLIEGEKTEGEGEVVKTAEQIAADAKAAEDAAAAEAAANAPLTAEALVLPEGMVLDDGLSKEFLDIMNNKELSAADRANALLGLQAKALTAASEASSTAWTTLQDEWKGAVKAEYGDKLQPTLDSINRLVTEHGDKELVEALAVTGAGNSLPVVKFFAKIAGMLNEGNFAPGARPTGDTTAAQRMFPSAKT